MYERFTDHARKVMALAIKAAQRLNHDYIGTEDVLLGLIDLGEGVGVNVLKNLDINLRKLRLEVERIARGDAKPVANKKFPQTPRSRMVIAYSIEESRALNHDYVGTEHLLLGLLREQEGVAAQLLMKEGLTFDGVREEIVNLLRLEMRATAETKPPPKPIEDLPNELKEPVSECDAEIQRLTREKEQAVADQDFERAAMLRDKAEKLRLKKIATIRGWIENRPIAAAWLSWNGGAVLQIARMIAAERSWDALPRLAEELEQAGCHDAEIIDHCRAHNDHYGRCWVVEVLLAKASRPD
jgi:ATP-dependent Clp protease ATP-binding subunit ClpA